MKNFISKILEQPTSQPVFRFVPQIKISPKSTLHLELQPSDPHTASNIVINAFVSKQNRTIVPIRVQWSRYKFKSDEQFIIQKIPSVIGNTYMCQPSDLGSVVQAKVKCLEQSIGGQAEATIGPIRIDAMLKRLIDGALYNQSLLSQIIVVEAQQKLNVNIRLYKNTMQFTLIDSPQKITMSYTFSQPKIQLSPKDPCKVYLRFQQDKNNTVKSWLNKATRGLRNQQGSMDQSSLSVRIPHSNVSSVTSRTKLFQKSHVHCINKLEVRFLSRSSRDLFLFTLRAFICKQDLKNSVIMQRIQTLQALKTQEDYNKFLEYVSLKSQIIRLAQIATQLQTDRDNKVKDINNMEESISEMTLTYLKIIQEKSQQQHVDLEQSYSMISMKRQEILGRKNFRQLKAENQRLKSHIRDLSQQIQLQKFFRKDDNESMMFNQTINPFVKKNISGIIDQNKSDYINAPEKRGNQPAHKNMLQISKSYLKVLQQNKKLKSKNASGGKNGNNQSRDFQNLLQSLHQNEEQNKQGQMQRTIESLKNEVMKLKQKNLVIQRQNSDYKTKLTVFSNGINTKPLDAQPNSSQSNPQYSYYSGSSAQNNSILSNSYISMNQSMTSEVELGLLEKKLIQLSNINAKFQSENSRLRKQRDYHRSMCQVQLAKVKTLMMQPRRDQSVSYVNKAHNNQQSNVEESDEQSSLIVRLKEQKQELQNQKNSLLKKIDSLTRQSNILTKSDPTIQKKCQQMVRQNEKLIQQNQNLERTIQNMRSFHQLQKKQLQNSQNGGRILVGQDSNTQKLIHKDQQIQKLKKVNYSLLNEIKQLKIQKQRSNDPNLDNSRVMQLQNQVDIFKLYAKENNNSSSQQTHTPSHTAPAVHNQQLLSQIFQLKKQNQRLKQQVSNLELKTKTQTSTIQKLMSQLDQLHQSQIVNSSNMQNSFSKKYLTPNGNFGKNQSSEEMQRYKKKCVQLQGQLQILRRNSQAVNRSRDLSMSMMGYDQERLEIYKKQNQSLMLQNQNLSKMCSKYGKDARQANIQLNKLRQKMSIINKERLVSNQQI